MGGIAGLLLAAGESRRMGESKALLPWQGTTLLQHQVTILTQAHLHPLVVVVGHRAHELEPLVSRQPHVLCVHNPRYRSGKTTSLRAGLSALASFQADAVLIINVDQPRSSETVNRILEAYHCQPGQIIIPTYEGKGGHPVIFPTELLSELMAVTEETQGIKAVVRRHQKRVHPLAMDSDEVLLDLNTPEEYRKALKRQPSS